MKDALEKKKECVKKNFLEKIRKKNNLVLTMPIHNMNPNKSGFNWMFQVRMSQSVRITIAFENFFVSINVSGKFPFVGIQTV